MRSHTKACVRRSSHFVYGKSAFQLFPKELDGFSQGLFWRPGNSEANEDEDSGRLGSVEWRALQTPSLGLVISNFCQSGLDTSTPSAPLHVAAIFTAESITPSGRVAALATHSMPSRLAAGRAWDASKTFLQLTGGAGSGNSQRPLHVSRHATLAALAIR